MSGKQRLDQLLVARGLCESRNKAQALILAGDVIVDDKRVDKPGSLVLEQAEVRIRARRSAYVGRGGDKLAGALDAFQIDVSGKTALDLGSSTGGFTDCLLRRGVSFVFAVDVGSMQLDAKLRADPRVRLFEQTHARRLPELGFDPLPNLAVVDVSFISLRKVLPWMLAAIAPGSHIVGLVKPQFELEPEAVGKGGVVRDAAEQERAIKLVTERAQELRCRVIGSVPSAIRGEKKGNQEYFVHLIAADV